MQRVNKTIFHTNINYTFKILSISSKFHFISLLIIFFSPKIFSFCVNASKANLRSGPGTKYEKTWEVYEYMPFQYISKKGTWYKVKDVDGDTHWIHAKLIDSKMLCVVIKVKKANLRTGPGSKYQQDPSYPFAEKYSTFKFIKRSGNWVKIQDPDKDAYWVHTKLVWIQ